MKRHLSGVEAGTTPAERLKASQDGLEFNTVEELLRHDAAQQAPPEQLRNRVALSASSLPPRRPWWLRWLGR